MMKIRLSAVNLMGVPGLLALIVFVLDQLSKLLVIANYPRVGLVYRDVIPGFFSLVHFRNTGAAWGMFSEHTWVLGLISALAFLLIGLFFRRLTEGNRVVAWAYGLLLGGIAGNLFDRWYRGSVVDFLFFYWKDYQRSWPAFNVADSFITVSVVLLVVYSLFWADRRQAPAGTGNGDADKA